MINVLFLFPKSADAKAVDDFLTNHLIPTNKKAPGLVSLKMSVGDLMGPGGPSTYARIIEANYDSLSDVMAVAQSPAGQAETEQLMALGAQVLMYEVEDL